MKRLLFPAAMVTLVTFCVLWWDRRPVHHEGALAGTAVAETRLDEPVQPLPEPPTLDSREVELGRRLFHEPLLSGDESVSCASCHVLSQGGDDGLPRPIGVGGAMGDINAPTVLNAALNFRQFWDGRAATLEEQVDGPIQNPKEMGSSWEVVIGRLSADGEYVRGFADLYPDGVTAANVRRAIATFERSLITPDSRFDRYLRGEEGALSDREIRGWTLFKQYGCIGCHQGTLLGGNMFQRLGIVRDYFAERGDVSTADLGRYNVTGVESDRHVFKVPSLRNVAMTAPYFHDGSARRLEDAVRVMARYQLGRFIPDADLETIVAFLETLDGQLRSGG